MIGIRIYSPDGQGVVTAAELLSAAAFAGGRYAQAFPSFRSERTDAPLISFCCIDDKPIRLRSPGAEGPFLGLGRIQAQASIPTRDVSALGGPP